jgi:hypothetical protein
MNHHLLVRSFSTVIACVLLVACAGAEWQDIRVAQGYQPPGLVTVAVVGQGSGATSNETLEILQTAIADELFDHGIKANFVQLANPPPRADVTVVEWDPGSKALRWLVGFGAGKGEILVVVRSQSRNGQPGIEGTAHGWVNGGWFGGSMNDAAEKAGHLIGVTIATGARDDD